jgi:diguanylate cyclase (GGDEF)-like protein/PAS domain S-box-containing protein
VQGAAIALAQFSFSGGAVARKFKLRALRQTGSEERLTNSLGALASLRRDAILEAIAISARELLRSSDLGVSLQRVVEQVGRATAVDRMHIFEIDVAKPAASGFVAHHYIWSAPGFASPPEFDAMGKSIAELGLTSWIAKFSRGDAVVGHGRDFDAGVRHFMEIGSVKSVLGIPIFVEDRWWGIIGFDDCRSEREWHPSEIDIIKILAEMVSAAVVLLNRLRVLADANRIIENSPTLVYRLGPRQPFPLLFVTQNIRRYGYEADELMAAPNRWRELIKSEDLAVAMVNLGAMAEGTREFDHLEFRFRQLDGSYVWFDAETKPLRDSSGRLVALEGVLSDITARKHAEQELASSQNLLTAAMENSQDGIVVTDQGGRSVLFNQNFVKMWNVPPEVLRGTNERLRKIVAAFQKDETEFVTRTDFMFSHPETRFHDELETKDGRTIDRYSSPLLDSRKRYLGRIVFFRDLTEHRRAERELASSHVLLKAAIENSLDAILVVDQDRHVTAYNQRFVDLWSVPREILTGDDNEALLRLAASHVKDEIEFIDAVDDLYAHPEKSLHDEMETKDGRTIERHSTPLYDNGGHGLGRIWFLRDITRRKNAELKIIELARTDSLTSLPNRVAFLDRLHLAFARAKRGEHPFAVLYLDLDRFKDVNDTLGHPAGDALLKVVAHRLQACVREADLVSRFGGDEFALLQEDATDIDDVEALATKICKTISEPFSIDDYQIHTSASIGIVLCSGDIADPETMLTKADLALYRAKNEGRGRFRFHIQELDELVHERVAISEGLHSAIEKEEFELYYQPQVELKSGQIAGVEALIRWNHPERGLLLPADFIPIAESSGSILQIGQWVIEQTCRQIAAWQREEIAPRVVAANVSAGQFKLASNLDRIVAQALAESNVSADRLELELTESVLMEAAQRHRDALERLRIIGVRFAIDDFGTGYSSFDYLRWFHVARWKIGQRFIDGVIANPDDAAIVRAVLSLAHELGIEAVAEGVQTAEQCALLRASGCQLGQGYYFWPPMSVASTTALLRRSKTSV